MNRAICISYCGDHSKGPPQHGHKLPAGEHSEMLRECVRHCRREVPDAEVVVCITATQLGDGDVREIDNLWDVFANARSVWLPKKLGYSEGAIYSIRQGVEAAHALGAMHAVHLCEDVVPHRGYLLDLFVQLERFGADYVGEVWRPGEHGWEGLSTQCFGYYVPVMRERFEGTGSDERGPERYLWKLMRGKTVVPIERRYDHTHSFADWKKFMEAQR